MKKHLLNECGQATTAALIILPVALTLFVGCVILIWAFRLEAKATAACRVSMVESQKEAAAALKQLLALNQAAAALEKTRQTAKVALAASFLSGNPIAVATARAALTAAEVAQVPVMAKQTAALLRGKRASWTASTRAREAMLSALPVASGNHGSLQAKLNAVFSPSSKIARFEVIASPPGARTPTYRTAPGFRRSQEARARWLLRMPTQAQMPVQAQMPATGEPSGSIEIGCAVTLDRTGGETWKSQWQPQITEDRLLPN